jgi:hypothetical protein
MNRQVSVVARLANRLRRQLLNHKLLKQIADGSRRSCGCRFGGSWQALARNISHSTIYSKLFSINNMETTIFNLIYHD